MDWKAKVEEESNGRLQMNIYSGGALGSLFDCVSNCKSGVTDGFWSGVTLYPGEFPATEVFGLPMIGGKDHHAMNSALQELVATNEVMSSEWDDFYLVSIHSSQACCMISAKPVKNVPQDWKGQNLRLSNAYSSEWMSNMGINPVSCGINDGYENISKGVIDGGLFFYDKVEAFALYELIDNIYVGETVWPLNMFCLNKDKYEALPDDLKAVIDNNCDYFTDRISHYFDEQEAAMMEMFDKYNVTVLEPTDEIETQLRDAAQSSWQLWVDTMNSNGYDGQALLDECLACVTKWNP